MAAHGARRLPDMAANLANVLAIEYLAAVQGCDFHAPLASSATIETIRATLRAVVPGLEDDRYMHADMRAALDLVRSDRLIEAMRRGCIPLPSITATES